MAWYNNNTLIPIQSHLWLLELAGVPAILAKSVDMPTYEFNNISYNEDGSFKRDMPGVLTWRPIKISFYDALLANVKDEGNETEMEGKFSKTNFNYTELKEAEKSFKLNIGQQTYFFTTQGFFSGYLLNKIEYNGTTASSLSINKLITILAGNNKYIELKQYTSGGNVLYTWKIHNPVVRTVRFETLDYSSDKISLVNVELLYQYAEMNKNENVTDEVEAKFGHKDAGDDEDDGDTDFFGPEDESNQQPENDDDNKPLVRNIDRNLRLKQSTLEESRKKIFEKDNFKKEISSYKEYLKQKIQKLETKIDEQKAKYKVGSKNQFLGSLKEAEYNEKIKNMGGSWLDFNTAAREEYSQESLKQAEAFLSENKNSKDEYEKLLQTIETKENLQKILRDLESLESVK